MSAKKTQAELATTLYERLRGGLLPDARVDDIYLKDRPSRVLLVLSGEATFDFAQQLRDEHGGLLEVTWNGPHVEQ